MSENENFSNSPFASLAAKLPQKDTAKNGDALTRKSKATPVALKPTKHEKQDVAFMSAADEGEDSALFLHAVQSARLVSKDRKPRRDDFSLAERTDLPKVEKKHNKSPLTEQQTAPAQIATNAAVADPVEDDAFFRAMREVEPLSGKGRDVLPAVEPVVSPVEANNALQDFLDGKLEFALALTGEYLEGYVVGLDEITMNKLRAGQFSPEAHLDLHGLNTMQAYQALVGFFRSAWYKGLRSVLVVPGRGRNSTEGYGILRDKLQLWLTQEPFKRVVLAFCTARPVDGGPGSVYVLLRKYRKKGKIYWERMPADPDLF